MHRLLGALAHYRYRCLPLTQFQLAQESWDQRVHFALGARNGCCPQSDTLNVLTTAVEWPTAILGVFGGASSVSAIDRILSASEDADLSAKWNLERLHLACAELSA